MKNINKVNLELEEYYRKIEKFDKLKIEEAKELCKKAFSVEDEKLKKLYLDKVILGTLYVVYNYVSRNKLSIMTSSSYDINDIISSYNEIWIKKIYNGDLLNVQRFSYLFNRAYFNEALKNLIGTDIIVNDIFDMPADIFAELLKSFITLKNRGISTDYNTFIRFIHENEYEYRELTNAIELNNVDFNAIKIIEKIYNNLNFDKTEELEISINKINDYLKMLIDLGMSETISEDLIDDYDMEKNIINKVLFETFVQDVDKVLLNDRQRQIIHQRYGLDDGIPKTLEKVAKLHNITRERTRQLEAQCLRLLRNSKIKKYK